MKQAFSVFVLLALPALCAAQIFTAKHGATSISFYSEAPMENIEATSKVATIVFQSATGDLQARLAMQTFKFKNALMEEHFNENYLESDKFPNCEFKGKVNEKVDLSQEGEQKVTVTGTMDLHGVKKEITIPGVITRVGNELKLFAKFPIRVADYNIEVPTMYVKNIAEVVDVTFNTVLEPFKKK